MVKKPSSYFAGILLICERDKLLSRKNKPTAFHGCGMYRIVKFSMKS